MFEMKEKDMQNPSTLVYRCALRVCSAMVGEQQH
jgi:hypothetical protein